MISRYAQLFRDRSQPLEIQPTGEPEQLQVLEGIRGVFFDVYGTMFISGTGDVGVASEAGKAEACADALAAVGIALNRDPQSAIDRLLGTIRYQQQKSRDSGVEHPEVDILEVWRQYLQALDTEGWVGGDVDAVDYRRLAIEYEIRANPVWPMPGVMEVLSALTARDLTLGIISNAQFYTLEMFQGLLGHTPDELGFDPGLQIYSFRYLQAKPGEFLYELARNALAIRQLKAENILYVGNDMLNDIQAANSVGFRTALFAGDRRSLRWRAGDPRVEGVNADLVLTDLRSLESCLV